jgi:hypothetical protein
MKKLLLLLSLFIAFSGCEKFLDITPSEGGIVKFNNINQYDALLNNLQISRNRVEWFNGILASDDCHFEPEWQTFTPGNSLQFTQNWEAYCTWNEDMYRSQGGSGSGFLPFLSTYNNMYTFNYIIETVEDPAIEGSAGLKKQIKAEAKFWRAFYHFLVAVEFCMHPGLNNGEYPGIGYRNSISPTNSGVEDRKTVKFTFDNIIQDLVEAEQALTETGKTAFDIQTPWRISAVTVQALLARVHLYMGNYALAFANAKKAYAAYNFLYDLNDQSLFALKTLAPVQTEVFNGVTYTVSPVYPAISDDRSTVSPASNSQYWYKEAYFRSSSQFGALFKMPPTQALYDMYSAEDLRKKTYFDNNLNINRNSWLPPRFKDQLISMSYIKNPASNTQCGYILGVTVPEIVLIMAECRARMAGDGEDAGVILRQLRAKRFRPGYVDNIGGTLQEVKDERRRELAMVFRWYDLKRYNALDNANIVVTKRARRDPFMIDSDIVTYRLEPNAPAYALPILQSEVELLGWQQNQYGGVSRQ